MAPVGCSFLSVSPCTTSRAGPEAGNSVVWLRGEHDISTTVALSLTIARAISLDEPAVVIDLSEVRFMSAATLGVILRADSILRRRSRSLTLRAPSACVLRIFEVCGLLGLLEDGQSTSELGAREAALALAPQVEAPVPERADDQPTPLSRVAV